MTATEKQPEKQALVFTESGNLAHFLPAGAAPGAAGTVISLRVGLCHPYSGGERGILSSPGGDHRLWCSGHRPVTEAAPTGVSLHCRESCLMSQSLNFPSLPGGEQVSVGRVTSDTLTGPWPPAGEQRPALHGGTAPSSAGDRRDPHSGSCVTSSISQEGIQEKLLQNKGLASFKDENSVTKLQSRRQAGREGSVPAPPAQLSCGKSDYRVLMGTLGPSLSPYLRSREGGAGRSRSSSMEIGGAAWVWGWRVGGSSLTLNVLVQSQIRRATCGKAIISMSASLHPHYNLMIPLHLVI